MNALSTLPSSLAGALPADLPSPTTSVWHLGPLPVRAYAMCILVGIVAAVWITGRRLEDRAVARGAVLDVSTWAVPFGIVGGRIYHVITSWQPYFGEGGDPWRAFAIWEGGLGIWGAIALGAVGAWIGCRRHNVSFLDFCDAAAPGLLVAQAIGRWGNWFNNEIHGAPTDLPWGLTVHQWDQDAGHAVLDGSGNPIVLGTFQPTFLYEALWCLAIALVLVLLDRRVRLRRGQLFGLYIMGYTLGRFWIELLRTDDANHILGLRVNTWVSALVFLLGLVIYLRAGRHQPDPVAMEQAADPDPDPEPESANAETSATAETAPATAETAPATAETSANAETAPSQHSK